MWRHRRLNMLRGSGPSQRANPTAREHSCSARWSMDPGENLGAQLTVSYDVRMLDCDGLCAVWVAVRGRAVRVRV